MRALATDTLIAAQGWDSLNLANVDELDAEQKQAALLIAGHYQAVFTQSEQGRFILRDMVSQYLVTRIANPGDDDLAVGIRQGQADVVLKILALIEHARTGGAPT